MADQPFSNFGQGCGGVTLGHLLVGRAQKKIDLRNHHNIRDADIGFNAGHDGS